MENIKTLENSISANIKELLSNFKNDKQERSKYSQTISLILKDKLIDLIPQQNFIISIFLLEKGTTYVYHKTSCCFDSNDKHIPLSIITDDWICRVSLFISSRPIITYRFKQPCVNELGDKVKKICRFQLKALINIANKHYSSYQHNIHYYCEFIRDLIQMVLKNKYSFGVDCFIIKNDKHWVSSNWSGIYNELQDKTVFYSTQHYGFWCFIIVSFFRHT